MAKNRSPGWIVLVSIEAPDADENPLARPPVADAISSAVQRGVVILVSQR
jgi:hypothetical protein